eukprot:m.274026 g.274026  ORF g.274026 m.274026 type:complete len:136 (+) comp11090_c1_seq53:1756-2163(+)
MHTPCTSQASGKTFADRKQLSPAACAPRSPTAADTAMCAPSAAQLAAVRPTIVLVVVAHSVQNGGSEEMQVRVDFYPFLSWQALLSCEGVHVQLSWSQDACCHCNHRNTCDGVRTFPFGCELERLLRMCRTFFGK